MPLASLSFASLLGSLNSAIDEMGDPRRPSNATSYSVQDAVLGALSAFFMQSESFLDYQRQSNSRSGQDNAQSLFGLAQIPSVEQIRNILDQLAARGLFSVFVSVYRTLQGQGYLERFKQRGDNEKQPLNPSAIAAMGLRRHQPTRYTHRSFLAP